ncbi:hypothetical protein WA158_003295 [Blastocystis sp. Blastoise]
MEIVKEILIRIESDGIVNAGYGSSLSFNQTLECDASIMDGITGTYAVAASIPNIKTPSKIPFNLLCNYFHSKESILIPPLYISGSNGLETSISLGFIDNKDVIDIIPEEKINQFKKICVGSSSGGHWLKLPGRVGLAGIPGSGFWCTKTNGCVISGSGESLFSSFLCRDLCFTEGNYAYETLLLNRMKSLIMYVSQMPEYKLKQKEIKRKSFHISKK